MGVSGRSHVRRLLYSMVICVYMRCTFCSLLLEMKRVSAFVVPVLLSPMISFNNPNPVGLPFPTTLSLASAEESNEFYEDLSSYKQEVGVAKVWASRLEKASKMPTKGMRKLLK